LTGSRSFAWFASHTELNVARRLHEETKSTKTEGLWRRAARCTNEDN
jgi:hypothetical protein